MDDYEMSESKRYQAMLKEKFNIFITNRDVHNKLCKLEKSYENLLDLSIDMFNTDDKVDMNDLKDLHGFLESAKKKYLAIIKDPEDECEISDDEQETERTFVSNIQPSNQIEWKMPRKIIQDSKQNSVTQIQNHIVAQPQSVPQFQIPLNYPVAAQYGAFVPIQQSIQVPYYLIQIPPQSYVPANIPIINPPPQTSSVNNEIFESHEVSQAQIPGSTYFNFQEQGQRSRQVQNSSIGDDHCPKNYREHKEQQRKKRMMFEKRQKQIHDYNQRESNKQNVNWNDQQIPSSSKPPAGPKKPIDKSSKPSCSTQNSANNSDQNENAQSSSKQQAGPKKPIDKSSKPSSSTKNSAKKSDQNENAQSSLKQQAGPKKPIDKSLKPSCSTQNSANKSDQNESAQSSSKQQDGPKKPIDKSLKPSCSTQNSANKSDQNENAQSSSKQQAGPKKPIDKSSKPSSSTKNSANKSDQNENVLNSSKIRASKRKNDDIESIQPKRSKDIENNEEALRNIPLEPDNIPAVAERNAEIDFFDAQNIENLKLNEIKEEPLSDYDCDDKSDYTESVHDKIDETCIKEEATSDTTMENIDIKEEAQSEYSNDEKSCCSENQIDPNEIVENFAEACLDPNLLNLITNSKTSLGLAKFDFKMEKVELSNINNVEVNNNLKLDPQIKCASWLELVDKESPNFDRVPESPQIFENLSPDNPLNNDDHFFLVNGELDEEIVPYNPPSQIESPKVVKFESI